MRFVRQLFEPKKWLRNCSLLPTVMLGILLTSNRKIKWARLRCADTVSKLHILRRSRARNFRTRVAFPRTFIYSALDPSRVLLETKELERSDYGFRNPVKSLQIRHALCVRASVRKGRKVLYGL